MTPGEVKGAIVSTATQVQVWTFTIYGIPQTQGSMRAFIPKGWTRPVVTHEKGKELRLWQNAIASEAARVRGGSVPLERAVSVRATFVLPRPKSAPKELHTARQQTLYGWPVRRPDLDKLVRAILDALTGVLFRDDGQVVQLWAQKVYGEQPGVVVEVEEVLWSGVTAGETVVVVVNGKTLFTCDVTGEGLCRSCGAEILWVQTPNGKKMPVDPSEDEQARHVSHFATCPDHAKWRR